MLTTLRVQVPDASMDHLHARARQQEQDLEHTASLVLIAGLGSLPPNGRFVVLDQQTLLELETILGGGSVTNAADLRAKVQRLAGITFGHVRLNFTPGQLETLQEKATRQGKSVDQLVEQMAPRIHEQFFGLFDQRG